MDIGCSEDAITAYIGLLGRSPYGAGLSTEASEVNKLSYNLMLKMGGIVVEYKDNGTDQVCKTHTNSPYGPLLGAPIDKAVWELDADSGLYTVKREAHFHVIAFGEEAISSLPEFGRIAVAYEQAMNSKKP